jgi:ankyrin repeat protein
VDEIDSRVQNCDVNDKDVNVSVYSRCYSRMPLLPRTHEHLLAHSNSLSTDVLVGAQYGNTALHWAARFGEIATIEKLVSINAEINSRTLVCGPQARTQPCPCC